MIGKNEVARALDGAFCAAFMLTGSMQAAEHAVLNGIAATECYGAGDDTFLLGTIKAAIQRRADSPHQSHQRCAPAPYGASTAVSTCADLSRLFRVENSPRNTGGDLLKDFASPGRRDRGRAVCRPTRSGTPRSSQQS
jgi:hypothetical protein